MSFSRTKAVFCALLIAICAISGCAEPGGPPVVRLPITPDAQQLADGNSAFAFDLYHVLAKDSSFAGNMFLSPYSISTALSMTYAGARGATEKEMATTLHFSLPQARQHPAAKVLISNLDGRGRGYDLSVANRLWARNDVQLLTPFLDTTREEYNAELASMDFAGKPEACRKEINGWIEDNTNNKIVDMLKSGAINPQTVIVLTNAIYFKGNWSLKFEEASTYNEDFYVTPDAPVKVPTMVQSNDFNYVSNDEVKMLELPYEGDDLSMFVLLPAKGKGLDDLSSLLTLENFRKWQKSMRETEVYVSLPKFKTTSEFSLNRALQQLGMNSAFSSGDFSGMTESGGLSISHVIHKAFVEVNEEGTEAAAATAVILVESAAMVEYFQANQPFIFLIEEKSTNSILFMGRITNPLK